MSYIHSKEQIYQQVGYLVAIDPDALVNLLNRFRIKVKNGKKKDLVRAVLYAIEKKGTHFHHQLTTLLLQKEEDAFSVEEAAKVPVGGGAIGAVTGIVGSVARLLGHKQQKRLHQQQARSAILSQAFALQQARENQLHTEKQTFAAAHQNSTWMKMGLQLVLGISGIVLLIKLLQPIRPSLTHYHSNASIDK